MNSFARRFRAALRFVTQLEPPQSAAAIPAAAITTLIPIAGIVVGLCGATVYWIGSHFWPTSVAVVVSMLATGPFGSPLRAIPALLTLLVKYDALMGLSAATGPLGLTPDLTLGLIMIAGHAAAGALLIHGLAGSRRPRAESRAIHATALDLGLALACGFAPAVLLGVPGLVALAAAILTRMALGSAAGAKLAHLPVTRASAAQMLYETAFYLGALATWKYV